MLEREAAKTALDLNLATAEFQTLSAEVAEQGARLRQVQEQCYRTEAELTEARKQLCRSAAGCRSGRAASWTTRPSRSPASSSGSTQGETESQDLEQRHAQQIQELERHLATLAELEAQTEVRAAASGGEERRARAAAAGAAGAQPDAGSGPAAGAAAAGRSFDAEESAGADRRVSGGVDRDTARSQREEEQAQADLERLARVKDELAKKLEARQMELESVAEQRKTSKRN